MKSKVCPACLVTLPLSAFNKDAGTKDGLRGRCRECDKLRKPYQVKQKRTPNPKLEPLAVRKKKSILKYEKTKKGFLMRTYRNMKSRVLGIQKLKAHIYKGLPLLAKDEFYKWALERIDFHVLFTDWQRSGYDRKLTPSIDRIDGSKGYIKGNIRWLTHSENSRLGSLSQFASQTFISTYKRLA